jgi:hypothetical protein
MLGDSQGARRGPNEGMYEFAAGSAELSEELLKMAQLHPPYPIFSACAFSPKLSFMTLGGAETG